MRNIIYDRRGMVIESLEGENQITVLSVMYSLINFVIGFNFNYYNILNCI